MSINCITEQDVARWKGAFRGDRNTLDNYQEVATKSAIYPGQGTALGLAYVSLKLNGEAGEFAEHVGKAMRDDALIPVEGGNQFYCATLTEERKAALIKEAGDVLWYLSSICNELGVQLSDVAYGNLCKLCDRGERGVLQGSGDER